MLSLFARTLALRHTKLIIFANAKQNTSPAMKLLITSLLAMLAGTVLAGDDSYQHKEGDEMFLYRSPVDDPDNCLLDEACFTEITEIINEEILSREYENLLSPLLHFRDETVASDAADDGVRRNLRGQRELWSCTQCAYYYGYWTCRAMGVCRRNRNRQLNTADAIQDPTLEEDLKDDCWVDKRIEYRNALQLRLMERAVHYKKYSVEGLILQYNCTEKARRGSGNGGPKNGNFRKGSDLEKVKWKDTWMQNKEQWKEYQKAQKEAEKEEEKEEDEDSED